MKEEVGGWDDSTDPIEMDNHSVFIKEVKCELFFIYDIQSFLWIIFKSFIQLQEIEDQGIEDN